MTGRVIRRVALLLVVLLSVLSKQGHAQDVRRGDLTGAGSSRRRFEREAEKQGRADFLSSPYDAPGTQVRITFDPQDADISLMTNRNYGLNRLLAKAQQIARDLNRSSADYITLEGSRTVTADIELNKYMRLGSRRSEFTLDLEALSRALQSADLPSPVVIGIDAEDAEKVTMQTANGAQSLHGITFYTLQEIPKKASVQFVFTPVWYAVPIGLGFIALLLSAPITVWRVQRKRPAALPTAPPDPVDPDEIQRRYDRRGPLWISGLFPLLFGAFPLLLNKALLKRIMLSWEMLSPVSFHILMLSFMGLMFLTTIGMFFVRRKSMRRTETERQAGDAQNGETSGTGPESSPAPPFPWPFLVGPLMLMPIATLPMLFPVYTLQAQQIRRIVMLSLFVASIIMWIVAFIWWKRKQERTGGVGARKTLKEGVWHAMVQDAAARAGVRVRRVVLITSPVPNAYASIFKTVALTTGLTEKLEPEEVQAIIAHEIGHLRYWHPQRTFIVSLVFFALFLGGWNQTRHMLAARFPDQASLIMNFPFLFIVMSNLFLALLLGPGRRRREREADRFAVQQTGNPELVIRALTKINQEMRNPARLKRSDEALSNHPSLLNRIEAIRRMH